MPIHRLLTLLRNRDGAIAIEVALATPILVLLLVGFVDLGMALHHKTRLESAARAGMQQALANPDPAVVTAAVGGMLSGQGAGAGDVTVTVREFCLCGQTAADCATSCTGGTPPATHVSVRVAQPFTPPVGLLDIEAMNAAEAEANARIN